jgi:hemerythrin-like domain-containing protein
MDEHTALGEQADKIRQALKNGDHALAMAELTHLAGHLDRHVRREEAGVFAALRAEEDFNDELAELEEEHRVLDAAVVGLYTEAPGFADALTRLLDDLDVHVEREELGIFPVSVVTLGAAGWATIDQAHSRSPSFLHDPT